MKLTSLLMLSALATPLQLVACTPQQIDEVAPAERADQARGEGPTEELPTTQLLDVGGFRMHLHCLGDPYCPSTCSGSSDSTGPTSSSRVLLSVNSSNSRGTLLTNGLIIHERKNGMPRVNEIDSHST